jgi:hypothetical protein
MASALLSVMTVRTLAAISAIFLLACSDTPGTDPDGGEDAGPIIQGTEATAEIAINEVAPRNGAAADWIEIVNRSDADVDLCNYFVSDSLDRLDHYLHLGASPPPAACTPVLLAPGAFHIIYADDQTALGSDHAPFKLSRADEVHLVTVEGAVLDSLFYLFPADADGSTLARLPSQEGPFYLGAPSLGEDNPEGAP